MGSPQPGLSFDAPILIAPENGLQNNASSGIIQSSEEHSAGVSGAINAQSATAAAKSFGEAIVAGRVADAFLLLPELEQQRVGSAKKFAEVLSRDATWLSSAIDRVKTQSENQGENQGENAGETEGEIVALRVTQTPMIDEIRGVLAPSSVVKLPASKEASGWKVSWERRNVVQKFVAPRSRLKADVIGWAASRKQLCTAAVANSSTNKPGNDKAGKSTNSRVAAEGEYSGGLLGAVWLADELCTVPGTVTISSVSDIYSLDDPQPLLDAYGSGVYQWARVVTLSAPHAMHVVTAPLGERWVVVAIAPVNSFN